MIVIVIRTQAEIAAGSTKRANTGIGEEASILGPNPAVQIVDQDHRHRRVVVLLITILRASPVQPRLVLVQLTIRLPRKVFNPAIGGHRYHQDPRFVTINDPRRQWIDFLEISLRRNEDEPEVHLLWPLIVSNLAVIVITVIRILTVAHQIIVGSTTQSAIRFWASQTEIGLIERGRLIYQVPVGRPSSLSLIVHDGPDPRGGKNVLVPLAGSLLAASLILMTAFNVVNLAIHPVRGIRDTQGLFRHFENPKTWIATCSLSGRFSRL